MESAFKGGEFHFNLESISFETDVVQMDGFKHFPAVAYKAGSSVMNGQSGNEPHIFGGKVGHQYSSHRPVHHIDSAYIA